MNTDTQPHWATDRVIGAAEKSTAAALLDLGSVMDTTNNLNLARELREESAECMALDEFAPQDATANDATTPRDLVLTPDAKTQSLNHLLCADVAIMQIDNPVAEQLCDAMRAMADRVLRIDATQQQLPMLVAMCYFVSKSNELTCLRVGWDNGRIGSYRLLWAAIGNCPGLMQLHYFDGSYVYDREPNTIIRWLAMKDSAANVESLTLTLNRSKTRAQYATLQKVMRCVRRFRKLEHLVIEMCSVAASNDILMMKRFAKDPPLKLRQFLLHHGEEKIKFI